MERRVRYAVIYEQGPQNWSAYLRDLPVFVFGDTREEVERKLPESLREYVAFLTENGEPLPPPSISDLSCQDDDFVEVVVPGGEMRRPVR